jgi:hypothetical protein
MPTTEQLIKKAIFAVEANSFERLALWSQTSNQSTDYTNYPKYKWEQMHGTIITVGKDNNRPVNIEIQWNKIDGQLVMFWYACSRVVNYKLVEKWFEKNFTQRYDNGHRPAQCDAMNFGHCLSAIKEFSEDRKLVAS